MNPLYVGIDVSSRSNVAYLMKPDGSKHSNFSVPNSLDGSRQLVKRILSAITSESLSDVIIGLEATSVYGDNLVCFLREDGSLSSYNKRIHVLNPKQVNKFKQAYNDLPSNINNLFPNKHPSIHPRLLWIISSNSNNPLQSQSWLISIANDTVIPASNPIHHFSFLPVTPGNKIPAGKSSRIFNRFSCNKPPSAALPNLPHLPIPRISFHDQNTSN